MKRIYLRNILLLWLLVGISVVSQAQQYYLKVEEFKTSIGCDFSQTDKYYHILRNGSRIYPVATKGGFAVYNQQPTDVKIFYKGKKRYWSWGCFCHKTETIWYDNTWSLYNCNRRTVRGRPKSGSCSSFWYDFTVNMFKQETPSVSSTNVCDNTYTRVTNRTCYGKTYSAYTWKIMDQDGGVYYKETSGKTLDFRLSDIYNSGTINNKYNKNIWFQVYPKGQSGLITSNSSSIRFYPNSPVISTPQIKGTTCSADLDAAISIASTTMGGNSDNFEYTLSKLIEASNGSYSYGGKKYKKSLTDKYTKQGNGGKIDFTGLGGGTYWLIEVNSAGNLSACRPATKILHIPATPVFSITAVKPQKEYIDKAGKKYQIARHGDKANLQINVSGGVAPYRYSLNGGATYSSNISQTNYSVAVAAGTYQIRVKTATGCERIWNLPVKMTQPDPLQKAVLASTNPTCASKANGSLTFSVSGGITPYTIKLNGPTAKTITINSAGTHVVNDLLPGNYTYELKDAPNAYLAAANAANLQNPVALQLATFETAHLTCYQSNNGSVKVQAQGGAVGGDAANYTYTLTPNVKGGTPVTFSKAKGQAATFTNLAAGNYTLTAYSDVDNNCMLTQNVTINGVAQITASVALQQSVTCKGGNDGAIQAQISGGTAPYTVRWVDALGAEVKAAEVLKSNVAALTTGAGTYRLQVKDVNNCPNGQTWYTSATVKVDEPAAQLSLVVAGTQKASCVQANDGEASLQAKGGWGVYTFSKDGTKYQSASTMTGLTGGKHTFYVKDNKGCVTTINDVMIETVDPIKAVPQSLAVTQVNCKGGNNGRISFSFAGGNAPFKVSLRVSGKTQNVATKTLNAGGTQQVIFDQLFAANYQVVIEDTRYPTCNAYTYPETGAISVSEPNALSIQTKTVKNATCFGSATGSLKATALGGSSANGKYTYTLIPKSAGSVLIQTAQMADFTQLQAGNYDLKVSTGIGCVFTESITIAQPTQLVAQLGQVQNINCFGAQTGTAQYATTGGTAPYQIAVDGGAWQNGTNLSGLKADQDYNVQIKDANGCTVAMPKLRLTQPRALTIAVTRVKKSAACNASVGTGEVDITVTEGVAPYTYIWRDQQQNVVGNAQNLQNAKAGVYEVTVQDAKGCVAAHQVSVANENAPVVKLLQVTKANSCADNGHATLEVVSGLAPITLNWDNGETGTEATQLSGGQHWVTITDGNGCVSNLEVNVDKVAPIQVAESYSNPTCNASKNGRIEVQVSGGEAPYTYQWNVTGAANVAKMENLGAGQYTLTITDKNGCAVNKSYNLTHPEPLQVAKVTGASQNPTCFDASNGQLAVQASGGSGNYTYTWTSNQLNGKIKKGALLSGLHAGTYTLEVSDGKQCVVTQTYTLDNPRELKVSLGGEATVCSGQDITLDAGNPGATYRWVSADGSFGANTQTVTINKAGEYTLIVSDNNGECTATDKFTLHVSESLLQADFLMDEEVAVNDSLTAIEASIIEAVSQQTLPDRLLWEVIANDKGNQPTMLKEDSHYEQVFTFPATGTYTIRMHAWLGNCHSVIEKTIAVKDYTKPEEQLAGGGATPESNIKIYRLYPNPNNGKFSFQIELKNATDVKATIYNGYSLTQVQQQAGKSNGSYTFSFDAAGHLSQGTHYLIVDTPKERKMIRFVVF